MSNHAQHSHHVTPWTKLAVTYGALVVLMLMTVGVVYFPFHSSYVNNLINLGIALVKATLVVRIFMGVKWGTTLIKTWAYTGFVWLTLMSIIFGDYLTRPWEHHKGWYTQDTERSADETTMQTDLTKKMHGEYFELRNGGGESAEGKSVEKP